MRLIILVFIFKEKGEIAMSNKNKTQSCGNKCLALGLKKHDQ